MNRQPLQGCYLVATAASCPPSSSSGRRKDNFLFQSIANQNSTLLHTGAGWDNWNQYQDSHKDFFLRYHYISQYDSWMQNQMLNNHITVAWMVVLGVMSNKNQKLLYTIPWNVSYLIVLNPFNCDFPVNFGFELYSNPQTFILTPSGDPNAS